MAPDMPRAVAQTLGIDPRQVPKDAELDRLFEAKRADTGAPWSKQARQISGFDFVFSPEKSVSFAAAFATTPAEAAAIKNATLAANDAAMRYAAACTYWLCPQGGMRERTVQIRARLDGSLLLTTPPAQNAFVCRMVPTALPISSMHRSPATPTTIRTGGSSNRVVTEDGRIGSIDARALTADRVHEYGAYFQAQLADRLRALGVRIDYDAGEQAVVLPDIPESAVDLFSKRGRQVLGDAKAFAKDRTSTGMNSTSSKEADPPRGKRRWQARQNQGGRKGILARPGGRIGWVHQSVLNKVAHKLLTDAERFDHAYEHAARHLAKEFKTAAVIDHGKLRVYAVRGLIGAGIAGGRDDVDHVVALIEERGLVVNGAHVSLVKGKLDDNLCVTHTEQIRIEQRLCQEAQRAALDRSGALSTRAIRDAMALTQKTIPPSPSRRSRRPQFTLWARAASCPC